MQKKRRVNLTDDQVATSGEARLIKHPLIASSPEIMLGKPVIAGTRITVEHVMREIATGSTIDDLLDDHPSITRKQVEAAIEFGIARY
jgi:uncharacterized protein (DUF433 family)